MQKTRSIEEITRSFRRFLGESMHLEFDAVDNIEMIRTGKHLSVISNIDFDFQTAEWNDEK